MKNTVKWQAVSNAREREREERVCVAVSVPKNYKIELDERVRE